MPSGGGRRGREGERERDQRGERQRGRRQEQGRLGHLQSQVGGLRRCYRHTNRQRGSERERGRQAGRPHPWSASKVQVSYLAAAAAELYSLLEAFSWTNVAAGCIQLGGEASQVSNSFLEVIGGLFDKLL
jgi:hypothetical protein